MRTFLFTLAVLLGTAACGSGDGDPAPVLSVVSYNAGLARGFVDHADARLPEIGRALAALDADVVCLQEVWIDSDVDAIVAAAKARFPHHYVERTTAEGGGEVACLAADVKPLTDCVEQYCPDIDPANLAGCALENCETPWLALPLECSNCIAGNIGDPIADIVAACTTPGGSTYSYDGRNGVLLLSRYPLSGQEMKRMESYLLVRVLLHAVVDVPDLGGVPVFCTHLTADFGTEVPYAGESGSWAEEQGAQVDVLVAWMQEKLGAGSAPVMVVAGDLNSGPAVPPDIEAVHAENYAKLDQATFDHPTPRLAEPYLGAPATCTWCADNPLVRNGRNQVIDHVLFLGAPIGDSHGGRTVDAARVLDQPVTIQVEGQPLQTRLSDHYGVLARVLKEPD